MNAQRSGGVTVALRVTPRARQDAIAGWRDGRLHIRTTAPPLHERANDAVRQLLAAALGVSQSRVTLAHGTHGRDKLARIHGVPAEEVRRRLGSAEPSMRV